MACNVDNWIAAIVDDDEEEFEILLQRLKQDLQPQVRNTVAFKWLHDIPVFCTLCNNPEFIKKYRVYFGKKHALKPPSSLGDGVCVIDLANALNFTECIDELHQLYGENLVWKSGDSKVSDLNILISVLNIGTVYSINERLLEQTLRCLCKNGLDICARGGRGITILHEAVVKMCCSYDVHREIFSLGYDINNVDDAGATAFLYFLLKAHHHKIKQTNGVVKMLKLYLYQNPSIPLNPRIVPEAISYDRMKFPDDNADVSDDEINDGDTSCIRRVHAKEHLRLLPWLYKCGFPILQHDRDTIDVPSLFSSTVTYDLCLNRPRQLKDIARIIIRRFYPGRALHKNMKSANIPTSIRDYILIEEVNPESG